MDKNAILQAVSQALDAMGMDSGGEGLDLYGESQAVNGPNNVPIWSQLDAGKLGSTNGPIHDKSSLMGAIADQGAPPKTTQYGMPMPGQQEEMMTATGMV